MAWVLSSSKDRRLHYAANVSSRIWSTRATASFKWQRPEEELLGRRDNPQAFDIVFRSNNFPRVSVDPPIGGRLVKLDDGKTWKCHPS